MKDGLTSDYNFSQDRVVVDGHLITSQGPSTALDFAFAITTVLKGEQVTNQLKSDMLVL